MWYLDFGFRLWDQLLGTIARLIKRKGIKVLAITDNVIPHEKRPGDTAFANYFIKSCDAYVTMSKAVMKDLEVFTNSPYKKFLLHPLYTAFGERVNKSEARQKLGLQAQDKLVLFFGLIRKYKGLDMLLEAFKELKADKHIKLIVAGEFYEDKQPYLKIVEENQLQNQILWHDKFIANEEVKYYFSATDLVALPYRSATQSGVTQVSFQFEVPTLVTNVGGLGEIIPDKVAGYVVEPNAKAIATGITDYFVNERITAFTAGMIQEKKKYDWRIFVDSVIELYQDIK